jgi:tRNA threonylcarbamoyladenosine biosynthesis protein TsaB
MADPLFLSFETATRFGSVAALRGPQVLSAWRGDGGAAHSRELLPQIAENLGRAGIAKRELEFLSVAVGPGSFTGLRVGLATAQGLADTLRLPLVGVGTLEALATAAGPAPRTVALLPAGRYEVFAQTFAVTADGPAQTLGELCHARPAQLFEAMQSHTDLLWAGDGDDFLHADALREFAAAHGLRWRVAPNHAPLAVSVARIALARWRRGETSTNLTRALYARGADVFGKPTTA